MSKLEKYLKTGGELYVTIGHKYTDTFFGELMKYNYQAFPLVTDNYTKQTAYMMTKVKNETTN